MEKKRAERARVRKGEQLRLLKYLEVWAWLKSMVTVTMKVEGDDHFL